MRYEGDTCGASRNEPLVARARDRAGRQGGVIGLSQLLEIGFTLRQIQTRERNGWLIRVAPRAYRLAGAPPSRRGDHFTALLSVGDAVVLFGLSAAEVWGSVEPQRGVVHVASPTQRRHTAHVTVHRHCFHPHDIRQRDGLRLTSPERTLLDLAAHLSPERLAHAVHETEVRRLLVPGRVTAVVARNNGHRGTARLRHAMTHRERNTGRTRSQLEAAFADFARAHPLPPYHRQFDVLLYDGTKVVPDAAWPDRSVVLELDGREAHDTAEAFAGDRDKDRRYRITGWQPVRAVYEDLTTEADRFHAQLLALLEVT